MTYLHMHTVWEDGKDREGVDEDDLDKSVSGGHLGVDVGGVGDCHQAVEGYGCQAQGGDVDWGSLDR